MANISFLSTAQTVTERSEVVREIISQGQTQFSHKTRPATFSVMQFIQTRKGSVTIVMSINKTS